MVVDLRNLPYIRSGLGSHIFSCAVLIRFFIFVCWRRGITINRLAAMSDVKQSTLDNIVRGLTKNPRVKTLHKIALAFHMTLAEFLDFEELNDYAFDDDPDEE